MGGPGDGRRLRRIAGTCGPDCGGRRSAVQQGRRRVARAAAQKSRKREKPHAGRRSGSRRTSTSVAEQTLFFSRLRGQAKWMFVLLALVFGVGFVVFGVGGGIPGTSLGDIFRNSNGT